LDISELKNLIKKSASVLVLDNGDPSMVIIDYKTYRDLVSEKEERDIKINSSTSNGATNEQMHHLGNGIHAKETELLEKLNREISALKNQIETEERGLSGTAGID